LEEGKKNEKNLQSFCPKLASETATIGIYCIQCKCPLTGLEKGSGSME
jgi:hypothetical protein